MARYRKESNLFKVFFGVVGALLLVGLGLYFFFLAENPPPFEKITLCPIDKAITRAHTAVILDRTEGLNDVQKQAIRIEMRKALEGTESYEKVSLFEIVGRSSVKAEPLLSRCNPTRPRSQSKIVEKLETDEALALKQFQARFLDWVMNRLEGALNVPQQQDSPIMEVLQAVSVHALKAGAERTRKRLLIFSDMMQHSPEYSHYRVPPSPQFLTSAFFKKVRTDLGGVDVRVFYINRAGGPSQQPEGHYEFWESYFTALGASVSFVPIEGAAWVGSDKVK